MGALIDDPWQVSEAGFPWQGSLPETFRFLLNYAVMAPSNYNSQPWLFKIESESVSLFADRTRTLPAIDPDDRQLVISCGAALAHLCVAIRHFDFEPYVQTFPDYEDPDLLARVRLGPMREATLDEHRLFMAMPRRRTFRKVFQDRPIPPLIAERMETAAQKEGALAHVIEAPDAKKALADLIEAADHIQGADQQVRRERAFWIHPDRGRCREGVPGFAPGQGPIRALLDPFLIRTFDRGVTDRQLAEGAPALVVLTTRTDTPVAWLAAGQALSRLLLTATHHGLSASFLNQPVQVPALRARLASLIADGNRPQLVLRMGYGEELKPAPRRSVRDRILTNRYR